MYYIAFKKKSRKHYKNCKCWPVSLFLSSHQKLCHDFNDLTFSSVRNFKQFMQMHQVSMTLIKTCLVLWFDFHLLWHCYISSIADYQKGPSLVILFPFEEKIFGPPPPCHKSSRGKNSND